MVRASIPLLLTGLLAGACDDPYSPPRGFSNGITLESEHFIYYARFSDNTVCPTTMVALEEHFAALRALMGFSTPRRKIEYFKFRDAMDWFQNAPCPGHGACADGLTIFTPNLVDGHELVHAYSALVGQPPSLFFEGLAEVLSCDHDRWTAEDRAQLAALRIDWLAGWYVGGYWDYAAAAQLSRYLIDRFGIAMLMSFHARTPSTRDPAVVEKLFEDFFGLSLVDAWQAAQAIDPPDGICLTPYQCASAPAAIDMPLQLGERCGVDDEFRALPFAESTALALDLSGEGLIQLRACDGLAATPALPKVALGKPAHVLTRLPAGSFFLARHRSTGDSGEVAVQLAVDRQGWMSTDCALAEAAPLHIPLNADRIIEVPGGGPTSYVSFDFDAGKVGLLALPVDGAPVYLCDHCGQDIATCSRRIDGNDVTGPVSGRRILVVATGADPGFRTVVLQTLP